jgi:hypothetical protein
MFKDFNAQKQKNSHFSIKMIMFYNIISFIKK